MNPEFRFTPGHRLLTRKQYDLVFQQGRRCSRSLLLLYVMPRGEGETTPRLGMAVSRKVGKAVVRNKVRRRFREIFRHIQHDLKEPCDIVAVARPAAKDASFDELRRDFLRALCRVGALDECHAPPRHPGGAQGAPPSE